MRKTSMRVNSFLEKLKIPFWCIFAVILALELTASILRGLQFDLQVFLIVMGVCYVVVGLACVIFYVVTGAKLTNALKTVANEVVSSNRTRRLNKVRKRESDTMTLLTRVIRPVAPITFARPLTFLTRVKLYIVNLKSI